LLKPEDVLPDVVRPPAAGAFRIEPVEELVDVLIGVIPPPVAIILLKRTDPLAIGLTVSGSSPSSCIDVDTKAIASSREYFRR
jgi:hypothetical protein